MEWHFSKCFEIFVIFKSYQLQNCYLLFVYFAYNLCTTQNWILNICWSLHKILTVCIYLHYLWKVMRNGTRIAIWTAPVYINIYIYICIYVFTYIYKYYVSCVSRQKTIYVPYRNKKIYNNTINLLIQYWYDELLLV